MTDAKEVGVGNPAEENTFCHRTYRTLSPRRLMRQEADFLRRGSLNGHDKKPQIFHIF